MNLRKHWGLKLTLLGILLLAAGAAAVFWWWVTTPNVPVFMYHAVSEKAPAANANLFVTTANFDEQVSYLTQEYTTIFASDLPNARKFQKPVVITLDDGYEDNYTDMFPILKKYNAKATVFLVTSMIDTKGYLTRDEIVEMSNSGLVSFQSHTVSHPNLTRVDIKAAEREMRDSQTAIEKLVGKPVTVLSYPYGKVNETVKKAAEKYYKLAFITLANHAYNPLNPCMTPRAGVFRENTTEQVKLAAAERSRGKWEKLKEYLEERFLGKESPGEGNSGTKNETIQEQQ